MTDPTIRARAVLAASLLAAMLIGMTCIGRTQSLDMETSAVAMLGLLAGGLLLERALVAAWHRTLTRQDAALSGLLFGLPLSFFFVQTKTAQATGDESIVRGASLVVLTVGVVLIATSAYGAWRRRAHRT